MTRILIVEDDQPIAQLMREVLEDEGYQITVARTGHEGLHQLAQATPALVLCDVMLPELDGWHFCREMQAQPAYQHVPIVLTSAASIVDPPGDCQYTMFLPKPFTVETIIATVRIVLGEAGQDTPPLSRRLG